MSYGRDDVLIDDFNRLSRLREVVSDRRFNFQSDAGSPPHKYLVTLLCNGLCLKQGIVSDLSEHQVEIELGPDYPIRPPELVWQTPIFHPNILSWKVCLVGQNWGAKTRLDDVCVWLWDMVRYRLYNLNDPLDKNASRWAAQNENRFPLDSLDLRAAITSAVRHEREAADLSEGIRLIEDGTE